MKTIRSLKCFSLVLIISVLIVLMSVTQPWAASTAETTKPIKLRLGAQWPLTHLMSSIMKSWIKDIEAETQGKVKVKYFPAGQLLADKDALEKIGSGVADIGMINPAFYPQLSIIGVAGLPFLFKDATHGTKVLQELRHLFDPELNANKIKLLWAFTPPSYKPILTIEKSIKTLKDWEGLRLRSAGSTQAAALHALGSVPVVIPVNEMYVALQRGTVEGMVFPISAAGSFKVDELAKNVTYQGVNTIAIILGMNLKKWNSLPKEIQDKIMITSKRASEKTGSLYDNWETETLTKWKKIGINFYDPPASELSLWREATEPLWNSWLSKNEKKGLPAKKIAEEVKSRAEK